jgi:opacity protein-like surface antigen
MVHGFDLRYLGAAAALGLVALATPAAHAQEEPSSLTSGEVPSPFAYGYGEVETTRAGAMGGAMRAAGNGTTAPFLNPANLTLTRVYHIEALGLVSPESGRQVYGGAIVDSITNRLAGGLTITGGFLDPSGIDRSWLDMRLALAYPIADVLSIGLGGRYLKLTQDGLGPLGSSKASGGLPDPQGGRLAMVNEASFDAGLNVRAGDSGVVIGLSAQNLTFPDDGLLPTTLGGGLAYATKDLTIEVDTVGDFTSYREAAVRVMAGGEYLVADRVPVRLGYRFDQGADSHALSGGLGFISPEFSIEASVRRTLAGPEATTIFFGVGYFLESSGLTGRGGEGF